MTSPPQKQVDVLIVGAGPVGLALACELRRWGVRCLILDKGDAPTPISQSRALGIHARTLEALHGLGVAGELVRQGRCIRAVNAWDGGNWFARFELDFDQLGTPHPYVLVLPQGATEDILVQRLSALGTNVEWQKRLIDLSQDHRGVTALIRGPDGRDIEAHASYLVGCDGAHSTVRHRLGFSFEGRAYEEQLLLADVHLDWNRSRNEAHVLLHPDGPIPAIPLPEPGAWRLIDTTGVVVADERAAITARFAELLRETKLADASITSTLWASSFKIHRRAVDRLRIGRCFLAGDAAHIHSPVGGQGMNIGIQDACNLAWKLALVLARAAPEALLDSYQSERLPIARSVLRGTHVATRAIIVRNAAARAIRNYLAAWFARRRFIRQRLTRQLSELSTHYRGSSLVSEDRSGPWAGPRPGERMPDASVTAAEGPGRLFDVLYAPAYTLLYFHGARSDRLQPQLFEAIRAAAQRRWPTHLRVYQVLNTASASVPSDADRVLIDSLGELQRSLDLQESCLYLVRPDGYVAYRSRPPDPDKLRHYVQQSQILNR